MLDSEGPVCAVVDPSALPPEEWKRLYEREHARAEAACPLVIFLLRNELVQGAVVPDRGRSLQCLRA